VHLKVTRYKLTPLLQKPVICFSSFGERKKEFEVFNPPVSFCLRTEIVFLCTLYTF